MKVLRISKTANDGSYIQAREEALNLRDVHTVHLSPTLLSAFTAMRAAKIVDKQMIDIIETDNPKNAMAAISARQLARRKPKVVIVVQANSEAPRGIPKDLQRGVDLWLFESRRLMDTYPAELKKEFCGITGKEEHSLAKSDQHKANDGNSPSETIKSTDESVKTGKDGKKIATSENSMQIKNVLRIGTITNAETIRLAMNVISSTETPVRLRICGAGQAATVMPLVRLHRSLPGKERIVWVGEEYDAKAEITNCDILLQADLDINPEEASALINGKHIITCEQLKQLIENNKTDEYSPSEKDVAGIDGYAMRIAGIYRNILATATH